jgi:hypothetical protein
MNITPLSRLSACGFDDTEAGRALNASDIAKYNFPVEFLAGVGRTISARFEIEMQVNSHEFSLREQSRECIAFSVFLTCMLVWLSVTPYGVW